MVDEIPMDDQITDEVIESSETQDVAGEQPTEAEGTTGSATEETAKDGDDLPKGIQKRFAKMTKERYAMQSELEHLRAQVAQMSQKPEPEYTREDFGSDEEAYLDYKLEQKLKSQQVEAQKQYAEQQRQVQEQQASLQAWQTRIDSYANELPNYQEVVANTEADFSPEDIQNIMESPVGPKIAYAIANDEKLTNQFNSLPSQRARDRFLTKLEIQLEMTPAPAPKPAVSRAQAPTPKASTSSNTGANFDPSKLSMADYVKWRNGEL